MQHIPGVIRIDVLTSADFLLLDDTMDSPCHPKQIHRFLNSRCLRTHVSVHFMHIVVLPSSSLLQRDPLVPALLQANAPSRLPFESQTGFDR